MKKSLFAVIALILILTVCTCQAADYTLPEKMYNQLAIGSGLKGSFSIKSDGDTIEIPFLKNILDSRFIRTVSDAEYSIRGIASGKDLHYYIFQANDQEQQKALSELYRKDGISYFRSDMVQGKILQFPTKEDFLKSIIPAGGENINPAQFIANILSVPENEQKEKWDPVLTRYQNELEMWLAGFAVDAETVKLETGLSALDFTYDIPMEEVNKQIVTLFGELSVDPEINMLLDSVMTAEEKALYANANLLYYYQDALNSFDMSRALKMKKRVSAIGEVLSFGLELPLDEHSTGYNLLCVDSISDLTIYTLRNQEQVMLLGIPEKNDTRNTSFEKDIWIAKVITDPSNREAENNYSVRINIKKTSSVYKNGEGDDVKNHEEDQYDIIIENNASYLPSDIDLSVIPEFAAINANITHDGMDKWMSGRVVTKGFDLGKTMDIKVLRTIDCTADFKIDISKPRTAEKRRLKGGKLPICTVNATVDDCIFEGLHFRHLTADIDSDGAEAIGHLRKNGRIRDLYCTFTFTDTDDMHKMKISKPGIKFHLPVKRSKK